MVRIQLRAKAKLRRALKADAEFSFLEGTEPMQNVDPAKNEDREVNAVPTVLKISTIREEQPITQDTAAEFESENTHKRPL